MALIDYTKFPCAICGKQILGQSNATACPSCGRVVHISCAERNGGCPTRGCTGLSDSTSGIEKTIEIKATKEEKLLERYGLDKMTNKDDIESVKKIAVEMTGTGLMELGMSMQIFSGAPTPERLQVYYQRAILEQNWIIIRQLDRLNANLEELSNKKE